MCVCVCVCFHIYFSVETYSVAIHLNDLSISTNFLAHGVDPDQTPKNAASDVGCRI